jgi:hypothetical protein
LPEDTLSPFDFYPAIRLGYETRRLASV